MSLLTIRELVAGTVIVVATATSARATPLLTAEAATQIETWLGSGPVTFTNLFTKGPGYETPESWHSAVDGQGPTISLFEATDLSGATYVIGGYNPHDWYSDSSSSYRITSDDIDRTAFIFNLTRSLRRDQKPANYEDLNCAQGGPPPGTPNCGKYQTYNYSKYGPTFGAGHDLNVGFDLTQIGFDSRGETDTLDVGYEEAYSYGPSLVYYNDPGLLPRNLNGNFDTFAVGALETYAIAPAAISAPEPATFWLVAAVLVFCTRNAASHRLRLARSLERGPRNGTFVVDNSDLNIANASGAGKAPAISRFSVTGRGPRICFPNRMKYRSKALLWRLSLFTCVALLFSHPSRADSIVAVGGDLYIAARPTTFTGLGLSTLQPLIFEEYTGHQVPFFSDTDPADPRLGGLSPSLFLTDGLNSLPIDGGQIASGAFVSTFIIHFEPPNNLGSASGFVTFASDIIGIQTSFSEAPIRELLFDAPGFDLTAATGMELCSGSTICDSVIVSSDRRTVSFTSLVDGATDDMRIFVTTAVPEPTSLLLLGSGIAALRAARRRQAKE